MRRLAAIILLVLPLAGCDLINPRDPDPTAGPTQTAQPTVSLTPVTGTPVEVTCGLFRTFADDFDQLTDRQRRQLINGMSTSAPDTRDRTLMQGVVDLGKGYVDDDAGRLADGIRRLKAACSDPPAASPTPESTAQPTTPVTPSRLPAALVGRWQGGANDAFWYTFTASGQVTFENRAEGVRVDAMAVVAGSRITIHRTDGRILVPARTWRVESTSVAGEAIHILYLDDDSYAKDEYY